MKIKYTIELDDFFIFSEHLIKTSPLIMNTIRKGQMWWACGPLVAVMILSIVRGYSGEKTLMTLALLSITVSMPLFIAYTHYFKYRNKKQIKSLHESGSYKDVLGGHEMTIADHHLIDKTITKHHKVKLDAINRVETVSDHTFVFTDAVSAYIIPHKKIDTGDIYQFIHRLDDTLIKRSNPAATK